MLSVNQRAGMLCGHLGRDWRDIAGCPDRPFVWPDWLDSKMAARGVRKGIIRFIDNDAPLPLIQLTPQGRAVRDLYVLKRDLAILQLRDKFGLIRMEERKTSRGS